MVFSEAERAFLRKARLGRMATVNRRGQPRVVPVGFALVEERNVIESGGMDPTRTRRWEDLKHNPNVALVVDELVSVNPWSVAGVQIRGIGELVEGDGGSARIRIYPRSITSWGLTGGWSREHRTVSEDEVPGPPPRDGERATEAS